MFKLDSIISIPTAWGLKFDTSQDIIFIIINTKYIFAPHNIFYIKCRLVVKIKKIQYTKSIMFAVLISSKY